MGMYYINNIYAFYILPIVCDIKVYYIIYIIFLMTKTFKSNI